MNGEKPKATGKTAEPTKAEKAAKVTAEVMSGVQAGLAKPGAPPPLVVAPPPDPSKPIDLKMVRAATLVLDQNDAGKALVIGRAMANGAHVDGEVVRLQLFPNGTVLVTVRKRHRKPGGDITSDDKHIVVRGDFEAEVMGAAECVERFGA